MILMYIFYIRYNMFNRIVFQQWKIRFKMINLIKSIKIQLLAHLIKI